MGQVSRPQYKQGRVERGRQAGYRLCRNPNAQLRSLAEQPVEVEVGVADWLTQHLLPPPPSCLPGLQRLPVAIMRDLHLELSEMVALQASLRPPWFWQVWCGSGGYGVALELLHRRGFHVSRLHLNGCECTACNTLPQLDLAGTLHL